MFNFYECEPERDKSENYWEWEEFKEREKKKFVNDCVEALLRDDGSAYDIYMNAEYSDRTISEYAYDLFEDDSDRENFEEEMNEVAEVIIDMLKHGA